MRNHQNRIPSSFPVVIIVVIVMTTDSVSKKESSFQNKFNHDDLDSLIAYP